MAAAAAAAAQAGPDASRSPWKDGPSAAPGLGSGVHSALNWASRRASQGGASVAPWGEASPARDDEDPITSVGGAVWCWPSAARAEHSKEQQIRSLREQLTAVTAERDAANEAVASAAVDKSHPAAAALMLLRRSSMEPLEKSGGASASSPQPLQIGLSTRRMSFNLGSSFSLGSSALKPALDSAELADSLVVRQLSSVRAQMLPLAATPRDAASGGEEPEAGPPADEPGGVNGGVNVNVNVNGGGILPTASDRAGGGLKARPPVDWVKVSPEAQGQLSEGLG